MKYYFIIFCIIVISGNIQAQVISPNLILSKNDLVGTWQQNEKIVGNGMAQNFEFFQNGTFILNLSNPMDDLRDIIQLKGKYRLEKNALYFTILSRMVRSGSIILVDGGVEANIFSFDGNKRTIIQEPNPKEISDPCYLKVFSKSNIKINQEIYYKISKK